MPTKRPNDQSDNRKQSRNYAREKTAPQVRAAPPRSQTRDQKQATRQRARAERSTVGTLGKRPAKGKKVILVDGSNVAYMEKTKNGKPKVSNLIALRRALQRRGWQPIIIVDAALRHQIDDPTQLEALVEGQVVRQAPAGTDADYFVLKTAENEKASVVSNDVYQPYRRRFPWIAERRIPLMIIQGAVELYEPAPNRRR